MADSKNTTPANIFAIVGFALLFVVAIWSGIQVVKYAPRAISGLSVFDLFKSAPSISFGTSKATVKNAEEFEIKWTLTGKLDGGAVSFLYKCAEGASVQVYDDLSKTYKALPCSSPFNMPISSKSLKLKAFTHKKMQDIALAIVYTNSKGDKIKDIKKITVTNDSAKESDIHELLNAASSTLANISENKEKSGASLNKTGNTGDVQYTRNQQADNRCKSKTFGTPDLSIHNLRTGTIAPNGYFVQKSSFYANETIVVKFTVSNNGTKTSPQWYFQANLPSSDNPVYTSSAQPAIAPCSGRHYTIKVINPAKGSKEIFVNVDPHNLIKETNEVNNNARAFINVY